MTGAPTPSAALGLGARRMAGPGACCSGAQVLVQMWQWPNPVPAQMWQRCASPSADFGGVGLVPVQMWEGWASPGRHETNASAAGRVLCGSEYLRGPPSGRQRQQGVQYSTGLNGGYGNLGTIHLPDTAPRSARHGTAPLASLGPAPTRYDNADGDAILRVNDVLLASSTNTQCVRGHTV